MPSTTAGKPALIVVEGMPALRIHYFPVHSMKRVYARLLLDAVTTVLVASRVQILLHCLADSHIFNLSLIAELYRLPRRVAS
jgi:hypothetical protein